MEKASPVFPHEVPSLSFKKEEFMRDDFSVDKFVSEFRKQISLETMREELGIYLRVLHSAMVELINKDYADFVNLSSNLVGMDKSIKNLSVPLGQLKEEILNVKSSLDEALTSAQKKLVEREEIRKKKILVQRIMCILEGLGKIEKQNIRPVKDEMGNESLLPGEQMERIAIEFNQIQFHISKSADLPLIKKKQTRANEILNILQEHLELTFLESIKSHDVDSLRRVLRVYATIGKVKEIENKFCRSVVRPYMRQVITENVIAEEGLKKLYSYVLDFIPSKCKTILEVTRGIKKDSETLKGYDFLVNSIWPEIVLCLEYIGPTIFAPGNPSLFHHNYCVSMEFVDQFEHSCVVQTSVQRLREHPSYESFMGKWNLLVYFQIRFQEIGGAFELSLLSPFIPPQDDTSYLLNVNYALWYSLTRCWTDDVYLQTLCHKFWKLTLQLLARYCSWMRSALQAETVLLNKLDITTEEGALFGILPNSSNTRCSKSPDRVIEKEDPEPTLSVNTLVMLVHDVQMLRSEIHILFKEVMLNKLGLKYEQSEVIEAALKEQLNALNDLCPDIGVLVVKHLTIQCAQHLKLVMDIPRLYRKTNREVPSKPSGYVILILKPLETFVSDVAGLISTDLRTRWLKDVIDATTKQYLAVTSDVITSIKKMEDSLKRLKRARDKSVGQTTSGAMTDDDKIRLQLIIDAEHFGHQIENLGVKKESIKSYEELTEVVESAMKLSSANS